MSDQPSNTDRRLLGESIFIMVFSAAMFGVTYTFDRVPDILAQGIQPTAFPRAILIIMFVLAAMQAVKSVRLSPEAASQIKPGKPVPIIVFITTAMLIAFVVALPKIGTFPTLIIFCPALAWIWGERRPWLMAFSFAGFIAFAYVLFRLIMNVPLP